MTNTNQFHDTCSICGLTQSPNPRDSVMAVCDALGHVWTVHPSCYNALSADQHDRIYRQVSYSPTQTAMPAVKKATSWIEKLKAKVA